MLQSKNIRCFIFAVAFAAVVCDSPLLAQEKGPVFWTKGGQWGQWLNVNGHPELAVRSACGDDTELKNFPVSSEDWQLRNNYPEPMAVVWRVEFFDSSIGKNKMGGWMLEHLTPGEVSDGWSVTAGHCKARNVVTIQVKCAVREADESQCYKSDGNAYPPRPDTAYRGAHNPIAASTGSSATSSKASVNSKLPQGYWYCVILGNKHVFFTSIFERRVDPALFDNQVDWGQHGPDKEFKQWVLSRYTDTDGDIGCYPYRTQEAALKGRQEDMAGRANSGIVDWSPK